MSKTILVALAIVLGTSALSLAAGYDGSGYGGYDSFGAPPSPGIRFGAAPMTVRTGQVEGGAVEVAPDAGPYAGPYAGMISGYGAGYGGPCDSCAGGVCMDWKLVSWYTSWGGPAYGGGRHCGGRCATGCGN